MAANAGYLAAFQIGPTTYTTVTGIKTCDLQIGQTTLDVTDLASGGWVKRIGGLRSYSLKIGGNFDLSDTDQAAIQAAIITSPGTTISWKLIPLGSGGTYSGTALPKTEGVKIDVKSEEQLTIDMDGTGAIAYA